MLFAEGYGRFHSWHVEAPALSAGPPLWAAFVRQAEQHSGVLLRDAHSPVSSKDLPICSSLSEMREHTVD